MTLKRIQAKAENQIQRCFGWASLNDKIFTQINLNEIDFYFEPEDIEVALKELAKIINDPKAQPIVLWPIVIVIIYVTKMRLPITSPESYWSEISTKIEVLSDRVIPLGAVEYFFCNVLHLIFPVELPLPNKNELDSFRINLNPYDSNFYKYIFKRLGTNEAYFGLIDYLDIPTYCRKLAN